MFLGDLNCPTCVLLRGALVGVAGGGIYPILLALPVNAGLAARCVYFTHLLDTSVQTVLHSKQLKGPTMTFWQADVSNSNISVINTEPLSLPRTTKHLVSHVLYGPLVSSPKHTSRCIHTHK